MRTPSNATVKLGTSTISQAESVSHVGIEIHKSFKSSAAINARIAKGRSSLFSILSIDRETSLINPITIANQNQHGPWYARVVAYERQSVAKKTPVLAKTLYNATRYPHTEKIRRST